MVLGKDARPDVAWILDEAIRRFGSVQGAALEALVGKPFAHAAYLDRLSELLDHRETGLSGATDEATPTVAEIAEQIKTLRAGQVIEAAPQRTGKRQSSAEEPVTARIRGCAEENDDQRETKHQERVAGEPRSANGR